MEGTKTALPREAGAGITCGQAPSGKNRKWMLVLAGTAAAVLAAGILYQVFRPVDGQAGEQPPVSQATAAAGKASLNDDCLARVNNEPISRDEVALECMAISGSDVLEKMINRKIIEQACTAQGIHISIAEVDQEVMNIAKKFNMTVDNWYQMLKAERNVTQAQYRRDIIWPMLALKKLAAQKVTITDKEKHEAFESNYGARVKVRVIVLDNVRRAGEVYELASKNPEDFERLVRKYSIDSSSRPLGGSVPPVRRHSGKANEQIEEAAFKLKKGEISPVVQVGEQYIIMLCEGRTEPVVTDYADVQQQLEDDLREEKQQQAVATVFQRLKDESRVDNYLTGQTVEARKKTVNPKNGAIKQVGATATPKPGQKRPATDGTAERTPSARTGTSAPPAGTATPRKTQRPAQPVDSDQN